MIIKHGLVVDPASGLSEHMDILVKNGKIAKIAPEISEDPRRFWKPEDSLSDRDSSIHMYISVIRDLHIKKISIQEQRHLQKAGLLL